MQGIGIFSWFSYDLPIEERLKLIKGAGFDATCLWWGDEEADKQKQPDMAREIGLQIDNIHAPFIEANSLWRDNLDGDDYQKMLISCVEDCGVHEIPTVVIHLTSSRENVPVTYSGLKRIWRMVEVAEKKNVKLAFENIAVLEHLDAVFKSYYSPHVGFCYDSGHENWKHPDQNCLAQYGDKLFALHINDNFGDDDTHMLPFDGNVDWNKKMQALKRCNAVDYFTLEVDFNRKHEKCVIYEKLSAREYLDLAYERAVKLLNM